MTTGMTQSKSSGGRWTKQKAMKMRFVAITLLILGTGLIFNPALIVQIVTGSLVDLSNSTPYETWRQSHLWGGFGALAIASAALVLCWVDIRRQSRELVYLPPVAYSKVDYGDLGAEQAIDNLRREGVAEFQVKPEGAKFTLELAGALVGTCVVIALIKWFNLWHPSVGLWVIILGPLSLFGWVFAWGFSRMWLMQAWTNYHYTAKRNGPFFCSACEHPLSPMPGTQVEGYLSAREKKLAEVKSVQWLGLYCSRCYSELDNLEFNGGLAPAIGTDVEVDPEEGVLKRPFNLFELDQSRSNFTVCSQCEEKALKKTVKVLQAATEDRTGEMQTTVDCKMCDHHKVTHKTLPKKPKS
ncbi:MAG: hypothetical protein AAF889_01285 [Cyanobacteria bacterium P01_D01_bin.73]